jgi:hypothetical protein
LIFRRPVIAVKHDRLTAALAHQDNAELFAAIGRLDAPSQRQARRPQQLHAERCVNRIGAGGAMGAHSVDRPASFPQKIDVSREPPHHIGL